MNQVYFWSEDAEYRFQLGSADRSVHDFPENSKKLQKSSQSTAQRTYREHAAGRVGHPDSQLTETDRETGTHSQKHTPKPGTATSLRPTHSPEPPHLIKRAGRPPSLAGQVHFAQPERWTLRPSCLSLQVFTAGAEATDAHAEITSTLTWNTPVNLFYGKNIALAFHFHF